MAFKRWVGLLSLAGLFWLLRRKRVHAPGQERVVTGVPLYKQYPELPTGCEATSLAMLLSWGRAEPVSKFAVANALPKGDKVHTDGTRQKGAHPNKTFVGDPYTDSDDGSYGVFEEPILEALEKFLPGRGINRTGASFATILEIVGSGRPVLAWTTLKQRDTFYGLSWTDEAGEVIDWYENEHAVVLVGRTNDHVIAHDPDTGKAEYYDKARFKRNWQSMGSRAVTLTSA